MAGVGFELNTDGVSLSADTRKTVLRLNAHATRRAEVLGFSVSLQGDDEEEAALVEVYRLDSDGTMSSLTPTKADDTDDETLGLTAGHTATVEPSIANRLFHGYCHMQSTLPIEYPDFDKIQVEAGGRIGILVTAPEACVCAARIHGVE